AGAMPVRAVLAAAAQIRDRVHAAAREPRLPCGEEFGRHRNIEAAVTVKNRRVLAVEREPGPVHEEHRHFRAVGRAVAYLPDRDLWRLNAELRASPHRRRPCIEVDAVDPARLAERLERQPRRIALRMRDDRRAADARELDLADAAPVER